MTMACGCGCVVSIGILIVLFMAGEGFNTLPPLDNRLTTRDYLSFCSLQTLLALLC